MLGGSPVPWQQSRHLWRGHVAEPGGLGIDVVQLGGDGQRIHDGGAVAAPLGAGDEP